MITRKYFFIPLGPGSPSSPGRPLYPGGPRGPGCPIEPPEPGSPGEPAGPGRPTIPGARGRRRLAANCAIWSAGWRRAQQWILNYAFMQTRKAESHRQSWNRTALWCAAHSPVSPETQERSVTSPNQRVRQLLKSLEQLRVKGKSQTHRYTSLSWKSRHPLFTLETNWPLLSRRPSCAEFSLWPRHTLWPQFTSFPWLQP